MIFAVKLLMTLTTGFLVVGYRVAKRDNDLHKKLMVLALVGFAGTALALVVGTHVFEQTYSPAAWSVRLFGPTGASRLLLVHRGFASISACFLIFQACTGWMKRPAHPRLGRSTLVLWVVSYVSGLVLFV